MEPVAQTNALTLDQKINEAFKPAAEWWEGVVFYPEPFTGYNIPIVVILLVLGALFFTLYFAFINVRRFPLAIDVVRGKYDEVEKHRTVPMVSGEKVDIPNTIKDEGHHGEVSHFQALATAVSGTVGLGNIAGVAIAISLGGPGATFWMIVCGLLGMSMKFVECTLGVAYREVNSNGTVYGGPMYYLSKGLAQFGPLGGIFGKFLAGLFAILCVGGSFGGGNAAQANQAASQIANELGLSGGYVGTSIGVVLAIVVGIVIIGGIKRIASVTEKVVPFMALLYILACLYIIFANFSYIDDAFGQIITQAFTPEAGVGGFFGVLIIGFRRAVFSNEAGAGSASIAHSAVRTKYPASEGIVALLEPFIDTVIICTMTALVVIIYNSTGVFEYGTAEVVIDGKTVNGSVLTSLAFGSAISWFPTVLTVCIVLFAVSTMISWSYYGLQAWVYLFGRSQVSELIYKTLFCIFIVIGAAANMSAVWGFSDAMILAMVFPNVIGLFLLFPKVKQELNIYLDAINVKRFFK